MTIRILAVVAFWAACGDNHGALPSGPPVSQSVGGFVVTITPNPAEISITDKNGVVVFDGLPGAEAGEASEVGFAFRSETAEYEMLFGSFKIQAELDPEPWSTAAALDVVVANADGVQFRLLSGGGDELGTATITAADREGELLFTVASSGEHNRVSASQGCDTSEHFLGFGGQTFDVDHRGQTVPIWVQEDGISKAEFDQYIGIWFLQGRRHSTHTPMPIYVSSRGYGLALDTPYRSIFAMCSESESAVRVEAWESELRLHLFSGPSPLEVVEGITAWTGRPEDPPRATFAPWIDAIYGEENVQRVADLLRTEDVPISAVWSEDWRGATEAGDAWILDEDWVVDRDLYPAFEDLADSLHSAGYQFFIYHNTFLDEEAVQYDEAIEKGYAIGHPDGGAYHFEGVKFNPTTMLDLTNEEAVAWMKDIIRDSLELGTDGYMADFAEWLPHDAVLASGEDALAAHNLYPVAWQRLNREVFAEMNDDVDRLFFVRSAYLGSQPMVSVVWAGDQQTDFSKDDGYPSLIPMGIGLGVTGFPYYGHDIAGYASQGTTPTDKELFFRWTSFGALSPVMRTHHGRDALANWNWEKDEETIAHFRRWAKVHMQLYPYFRSLAAAVAERGAPLFAPLALQYPGFEPGWTATDQYMLGDRLVVAPIIEQGATKRTVQLPEQEDFYPFFGGDSVRGTFEAEAEVEDIPVFVRAGTVLSLLPPSVDTVFPVADGSDAVTLDSVGDSRWIWVYPGGADTFNEFDSDISLQWQGEELKEVPTSATFRGNDAALAASEGYSTVEVTGSGTLEVGPATLKIRGVDKDAAVTVRIYHP